MAKVKTQFVCQNCGQVFAKWQGQCSNCGQWNTLAEEMAKEEKKITNSRRNIDASQIVLSVAEAGKLAADFSRVSTQIEELDRCLGTDENGRSGLVHGSVVLIGGEPGIGKSTLLTQVVINFCKLLQKRRQKAQNESCTNTDKKIDTKVKSNLHFDKNTEKNVENEIASGRLMYICGEESP